MRQSSLRLPSFRWILALLLGLGTLASVGLAPEPDPVPRRWEFDVTFSPLRIHTVETREGPRAFFYLTYRVVNKSGQDLLLAPQFELVVDKAEPVRAGRGVPADVAKTLLDRFQNPLILDQISAIGLLKQGEQNAREALIIFPADSLRPDSVTIYAAGFAGETANVKPGSTPPAATPAADPSTGSKPASEAQKPVLLRKTRMVRYALPGELTNLRDRPIEPIEARWIMR